MREKKTFQIKAQGNSMFPLLKDGDVVEYVQTPTNKIKINDITLSLVNNTFVTHRVIYKTNKKYITRGDNNTYADYPIAKKKVIGKVTRFNRHGKWYQIQDIYRAQSTLYLGEIKKLSKLLTRNNIPHVFMKGVLTSLHYENKIPERIYADCDILIERTYIKQCKHIFSLLGYQLKRQWNVSDAVIPEINFITFKRNVPVVFDLHFEPHFLSGVFGPATYLLYSRARREKLTTSIVSSARRVALYNHLYSLPSHIMQIKLLALHIFHHNFTDSVRYKLLDRVVRKQKVDWSWLAQTIKEYSLEKYVYLVFKLLKKYFSTPIPNSFFISIRPPRSTLLFLHLMESRITIFSQDERMKAGIVRFALIIILSPNPWWKKLLLFIHPQTLDIFFTVIKSSIRRLISLKVYKSDIF